MWAAAAQRDARGDWFAPLPAPRRPPCCDSCVHFTRDAINPPAGIGFCQLGHGSHYPMAPHLCGDHNTPRNPAC